MKTLYEPGFKTQYEPGFNTQYEPGFNTQYEPGMKTQLSVVVAVVVVARGSSELVVGNE